MNTYEVEVTETTIHYLTVEAATEEEASATAYQLLQDVDEDELVKENNYHCDSLGLVDDRVYEMRPLAGK